MPKIELGNSKLSSVERLNFNDKPKLEPWNVGLSGSGSSLYLNPRIVVSQQPFS